MTNSAKFSCPCLNVSFEYAYTKNNLSLLAFLQQHSSSSSSSTHHHHSSLSNEAFNLLSNHNKCDDATSSILRNYFLNSKKVHRTKSVVSSIDANFVLLQLADARVVSGLISLLLHCFIN